jgi:hypothetical protein
MASSDSRAHRQRESELARRERLVAARESEFSVHRPFARLRWALQYSPLTAIELGGVLVVVAGAVAVGSVALTLLGAILVAVACLARLGGFGRPR